MEQALSYINQAMDVTEKTLSILGSQLLLLFGLIAIVFASITVFAKNAVHSVLAFLATMLCIAACYFTLDAEFLGVAQLLIYAGGIVVLFLFVVMLVELSKFKESRVFHKQKPWAILAAVVGMCGFMWMSIQMIFKRSAATALENFPPELAENLNLATHNAQAISRGLFTKFLLPFETMSVILLIALVGAVVLAKQERV